MLPSLYQTVTAAIDQVLATQEPVGAVVGVAEDGRLIYIQAFGTRNIAKHTPVNDDTRFEIASITKQFTAAARKRDHTTRAAQSNVGSSGLYRRAAERRALNAGESLRGRIV
jgi:hypothetical protein